MAVQAANDTYTLEDRKEIQKEINQLIDEIDRIATTTQFNTKELLDGSFAADDDALVIHIGANASQNLKITIASMIAEDIGEADESISSLNVDVDDIVDESDVPATPGVLTQAGADAAITNIQAAIDQVSAERSKLGAYQNRLEHTIANLGTAAENLAAAESRIRDVDMAAEMMEFTKNQILQQAGVAMLAQANMAPQAVLQLLR